MKSLTVFACVLAVITMVALAFFLRPPAETKAGAEPEFIYITGTVRDFRERTEPGGHPDFEVDYEHGLGRYSGNVTIELGDDRKPVYTGEGFKISRQWRDADHRNICHALFDETLGDREGIAGQPGTGGITSAETFAQWFNDDPAVNMTKNITLRMEHVGNGIYVFDDKRDPVYRERRGFFPIDGQLFGNSAGRPEHNYHFTFELHAEFEYDAAGGQFFQFNGDDDVWVYIDNQLVVDLGGVHAAHDQFVDVNRLGLVDGETYRLDFFFAERRRTQSNFRIETNLLLENTAQRTISPAFD